MRPQGPADGTMDWFVLPQLLSCPDIHAVLVQLVVAALTHDEVFSLVQLVEADGTHVLLLPITVAPVGVCSLLIHCCVRGRSLSHPSRTLVGFRLQLLTIVRAGFGGYVGTLCLSLRGASAREVETPAFNLLGCGSQGNPRLELLQEALCLIVSELLLPKLGVILAHLEHPHHHKEEVDTRGLIARALLWANSDIKSTVRDVTSDKKPVWPALVQEVESSFDSTLDEFLLGRVKLLLGGRGGWHGDRGGTFDLCRELGGSVHQVGGRGGGEGGSRWNAGGRGAASRSPD